MRAVVSLMAMVATVIHLTFGCTAHMAGDSAFYDADHVHAQDADRQCGHHTQPHRQFASCPVKTGPEAACSGGWHGTWCEAATAHCGHCDCVTILSVKASPQIREHNRPRPWPVVISCRADAAGIFARAIGGRCMHNPLAIAELRADVLFERMLI
ncbi:MAG: hypothetical protein AB7O62_23855 [Pirellulales bacterium]